jgi:hypothetical protein
VPISGWSTASAPQRGSLWSVGLFSPPGAHCWSAGVLLLPVAWYLAVGSHRVLVGIPVGIIALTVLALLFSPAAVRWVAGGS